MKLIPSIPRETDDITSDFDNIIANAKDCGILFILHSSGTRWDSNWDMYEKATRKPRNKDGGRVDYDEESKEIKPTAVRHLVFIRHGHYYDSAKNDDDKELTELGREGNEWFENSCHQKIFSFDI